MRPSEPNSETATRDWLVPNDGGGSNDGAAEAKDNWRKPDQKDEQARDEKHPNQQAAQTARDQKAKDDKGDKQGDEPPRRKWPFVLAGVVVAASVGVVGSRVLEALKMTQLDRWRRTLWAARRRREAIRSHGPGRTNPTLTS
jgi:ferric-dicitrate binding protein FerR (iron transport regulator)